ncbi:MAG: hypothetical protein Q9191_003427 [Dirinaria sp. TL-2023a]
MNSRSLLSLALTIFLAVLSVPAFGAPLGNSNMSSPTIVLVPGAFHVDSAMDILGAQLAQAGYNTRTFGLLTVNRPRLTVNDDAAALRLALLHPLIEEQGKDIVLYLHSYAGFPGSVATAGLSKAERLAAGKPGGILGLIYQSAFVPKQGDTLLKMIGGSYAPWQDPNTQTGLITVIDPKNTFYADVPEPLASEASNQIYGQSLVSFNSPSSKTHYGDSFYNNRRVYLHTNLDQALPPFAQDAFVANSGVAWNVQKLDTSHSPFLSEPAQLAAIVQTNTQAFMASY